MAATFIALALIALTASPLVASAVASVAVALVAVTLEALALFCLGLVRLGLSGLDGLDLVGLSHRGHGGLGVPRWAWSWLPWCAPLALAMAVALMCPVGLVGLGLGCFGLEWP